MTAPEVRARIRRLFFAEHWPVGTIVTEPGVHPDTVRRAIESESFNRPASRLRSTLVDTRTRPSSPTFWNGILDFDPRGSTR